ncbi:histidine kinase [Lacihabitans sp. LS3-19]|uniref:sensor histidine kinase n=1 Tax=Lacihabitans sp. LS3-19 TaxID=2487335 RepID=UPI0020CCDFDE|nr:histidine kinase [Lacihabitans sp. LS3-19]MCP9770540.1 histidine kinase [Lacihabitans sp. LS3-19]
MEGDQERYELLKKLLPLGFFSMPFFYFNSEFLIQKFLPKGQVTSYILSLLLLFVVFLVSYYFLKDYLIDKYPIRIYDTRTLFPVLFIISMSTLYGFIIFMISQSKKNQEEQAERLKSELSFLRSQISPHFIFNVLNSIVYLIRTKSKSAENVTLELSNLIRYMLYETENKQVLLEKEIEYLENYVKLQNVRFGEDVKINLEMKGEPGSKMIEPMLLIPFVENAFKHGVGFLKDPKIDILIDFKDDNKFEFSVKNLVGAEKKEQKDPNSGIGIRNVKRRIELLYPKTHKLIMNNSDGIFEVILMLDLKNKI